jgi:ABC-type multidrug transport system ATPase subunit
LTWGPNVFTPRQNGHFDEINGLEIMTSAHITHLCVKNLFAGWKAPKKDGDYISKHINFEVSAGEILAIMGPSGAGKTTLLKGLFGRVPYRKGQIALNGKDISKEGLQCVSKRVGMVPQRDVLVDELTVEENIAFFHKVAVDSARSDNETQKRIASDLDMLGMTKVTRSRVKDISGGQAKRANIAMELINDPDILIIDEPTSGLSSQDSLALIQQLRRIANSGKIVIIIIHQPSSDIYKLFDRVLLLDKKGHCIRSGKAMEIMQRFVADADCSSCSSVFPEKLLTAIEDRDDWLAQAQQFSAQFSNVPLPPESDIPRDPWARSPLKALGDLFALMKRQWLIRSRDRMSQLITYAAPPLLGLLIASVFKATPEGQNYSFAANVLYPQALFLLIIGAVFLGMVSTIFEVIKDRDIFERERQRGLSPGAYFLSELVVASFVCAIQSVLLTLSAMLLLDAGELFWRTLVVIYLVQLISVCIGLLLSTLFSTPIGAYNVIILVLIPQIILGGAMLPYKDMGKGVYLWETRDTSQRPIPGALMPSSWAYQMVVRLNFDAMRDLSVTKNMAIAETEYLKPGSFLSPNAQRMLKSELAAVLPAGISWERAHVDDALVLLLIFLGLAGSGFIWIYRTEHGKTGKLWVLQGAWLTLLPIAYDNLTEPNTSKQGRAINYISSVAALPWNDAMAYCRARQGELTNAPDTAAIFNGDKTLKAGNYWTREVDNPGKAQQVWHLRLARSPDKPVATEREVLKSTAVMNSTTRLAQKMQFVCIVPPG